MVQESNTISLRPRYRGGDVSLEGLLKRQSLPDLPKKEIYKERKV